MDLENKFDKNEFSKFVLMCIIITEIVIGIFFLSWFQTYQQNNRVLVLGGNKEVNKPIKIDKNNLIFSKLDEYKYYFELKPDISIKDNPEWLSYEAVYTHNSDGLNDTLNYKIDKPKETFRIVALGDSFTYGHYVDTEDSWPEKLEVYLNESFKSKQKYEVLNLGVHGFDFLYIVKRFREVGAKYKPDLVLWFESGSGFYRFTELMRPMINKCEAQNTQTKKEIDERNYHNCWIRAQKEIERQYSREKLDLILSAELGKFFKIVNPKKLIYFSFAKNNFGQKPLKLMEQWQDDYPEARFVNIVPPLSKSQYLPDGHPNKEGHKLIAQEILNYLKANQIIDE